MIGNGFRNSVMAGKYICSLLLVASFFIAEAEAARRRPTSSGAEHVRWKIKTSIPTSADVSQSKVVDLEAMLLIQPPPGAKGHSRAMDHDRYPADPDALGLTEGDIISVKGWLHLIAAETDDEDFHIQISHASNDQSRCLIVEVPRPTAAIVKDQRVRNAASDVRDALVTNALGGNTLSLGSVRVVDPPIFVRVTGQFFYDDWHIGGTPRGKKGCKSPTIAEVHPIMAIEFPSGARF
jgi:hypothetical protein